MKSALVDAIGSLGGPLRALTVAMVGALLAWLWFDDKRLATIGVILAALLVALLLDAFGRSLLSRQPRSAIELLEWWILAPLTMAATAAAASIIATVELTVPDNTATSDKEVIAAVASAITAFLSTSFVEWAGDDKESRVSDRIQELFETEFKGRFASMSEGELYVFANAHRGAVGWGRKARRLRAQGIATQLRKNRSR